MKSLYANFSLDWNKNFIGYAAMAIILSTCTGSVAVMTMMAKGNGFLPMLMTFFVVIACSGHNASILTNQKPDLVFKLLVLSVTVSLSVILYGIL